jgi:hypothetical protein
MRTVGFADHLLVTQLLQELIDVRYEYLAIQESLYRRLLNLFTVAKTGFRQEFTRQATLATLATRGRTGSRSLYIWSESFAHYENSFLLRAFQAKGISRAIISVPQNLDHRKLAEFIALARLENLEVELMLSENGWVWPEKWPKALERIQAVLALGQPLHLDIEPHVLPGYKADPDGFRALFLEFLKNIRAIHNGATKIAVSLPVHHDQAFIEAVGRLTDKIYIMAYEITDLDRLGAALKPFASLPKEKAVIACRPRDFGAEPALERFLDQIAARYGFSSFAFHDLRQYFEVIGQERP